nr:MAG TPA: hypothetical protein [Caudoviricetes sp.]
MMEASNYIALYRIKINHKSPLKYSNYHNPHSNHKELSGIHNNFAY